MRSSSHLASRRAAAPTGITADPAAFLEAADLRSPDYANESGQPIGVSIVHVDRALQILRSGEGWWSFRKYIP